MNAKKAKALRKYCKSVLADAPPEKVSEAKFEVKVFHRGDESTVLVSTYIPSTARKLYRQGKKAFSS